MERIPLYSCIVILILMTLATIQRNYVWASAESLWKDAAAKSPSKPRPHMNVGRLYQLRNNLDMASASYKTAIRLAVTRLREDPSDFTSLDLLVDAQSNLGLISMQRGDVQDAELWFRASLSIIPGAGPPSINYSNLLIGQKRFAEAHTVIDDSLTRHPFGSAFYAIGKLYFNKAIAFSSVGDCQNAQPYFDLAAQVDPDIRHLECSTKG